MANNWENIKISIGYKKGKEICLTPKDPGTINVIRPLFKKDSDHDETKRSKNKDKA